MTEGSAQPVDLGIDDLGPANHLGAGGSANVFAAKRISTGEDVAVKLLRASSDIDKERRRFLREQETLSRLADDRGIVPILASGMTDRNEPYFLMPLMACSLQDRIDDSGPLGWEDAAKLVASVADTVENAHRNDVLHRDLKPGNILVDAEGTPRVSDFGIAKMMSSSSLRSSTALGTPSFMPPERFTSQDATEQSDVYGLAATLAALITGSSPFLTGENDDYPNVMHRVLNDAPPALDTEVVPHAVAELVVDSMAKDPTERPESAAEFASRLRAVIPSGSDGDVTVAAPFRHAALHDVVAAEPAAEAASKRGWYALVAMVLLVAGSIGLFQVAGAGEPGVDVTVGGDVEIADAGTDAADAGTDAAAGSDGADDFPQAESPDLDEVEPTAGTSSGDAAADDATAADSDSDGGVAASDDEGADVGNDPSVGADDGRIIIPLPDDLPTLDDPPAEDTVRPAPIPDDANEPDLPEPRATDPVDTPVTQPEPEDPEPTTKLDESPIEEPTEPEEPEQAPAPVACFSMASSVDVNVSVSTSNCSSNATSYRWDFGDGSSSTSRSPSHRWSNTGRYTVSLTATGAGGSHSTSRTITVNAEPIIEDPDPVVDACFTVAKTSFRAGESLTFTNCSDGATSFSWNFGDGQTSSARVPQGHTWDNPGTYTITLTASNGGVSDSASRTVEVIERQVTGNGPDSAPQQIRCAYVDMTNVTWTWSVFERVDVYIVTYADGSRREIGKNGNHTTTDGNLRSIAAKYQGVEKAASVGGGDCSAYGGEKPGAGAPPAPSGISCRLHDFVSNAANNNWASWSETWSWNVDAGVDEYVLTINRDGVNGDRSFGRSGSWTEGNHNGAPNSGVSLRVITAVANGQRTSVNISNCLDYGGVWVWHPNYQR